MNEPSANEDRRRLDGPGPAATRLRRTRRAGFTGALVALALLSAATASAAEPDTSRTKASDGGAFVVAIESRVDPVPLNAMHAWVVSVETAEGVPVEGATFGVGGGMPMHDHGLPTAPRVTEELGGGDYLLEGVKFQMPGHWVMDFDIDGAGVQDSVTFELML